VYKKSNDSVYAEQNLGPKIQQQQQYSSFSCLYREFSVSEVVFTWSRAAVQLVHDGKKKRISENKRKKWTMISVVFFSLLLRTKLFVEEGGIKAIKNRHFLGWCVSTLLFLSIVCFWCSGGK